MEATDGAFDIAIYPVMKAWDLQMTISGCRTQTNLRDLLTLTDASDISYDKETSQIAFKRTECRSTLEESRKVILLHVSWIFFVPAGSRADWSILVEMCRHLEQRRMEAAGAWQCRTHRIQISILGVLSIQDKAVITSGGYERYFEQDGRTYHHIIDPKTGYPVENGLISVSIVTADGTLADGLSTSVFIMGKEAATEYWRNHSDEFDMILMTDDREIYVTEGIADSFESEMDTKIIEKKYKRMIWYGDKYEKYFRNCTRHSGSGGGNWCSGFPE